MMRTRRGSGSAGAMVVVVADEDEVAKLDRERVELENLEAAAMVAAKESLAADETMQGEEAELTSLTWLQSLDITTASGLPTPPCSPTPPATNATHHQTHQQQQQQQKPQPKKMSPLLKAQLDLAVNAEKYLHDPNMKPPYSYATLICLAMRDNNNKITLSRIYAWIRENFIYYRDIDPAWQNSIRHNLSLNKCFVKLPRSKDERGKGGFWKLDLERLQEGRRTRRRTSNSAVTRRNPPKRSNLNTKSVSVTQTTSGGSKPDGASSAETDPVAKVLGVRPDNAPRCVVLYETPPSSVSPPIPDSLLEVPDSNQVNISEEDFTDLLIDSAAWEDGVENHLALLDSVLDML
ncbi:hypothetical protein QAD02_018371 [Eretmocerus hayati]|uniref:Uncharacterized protein n=1 Tax=Eretmocerus hayati TaxID=131215 RepID=A0ACC2PJ07_9HYME|nr:hypothetical protein QAD02_018371 [Eretmocerus hayati]